MSEEIEFTDKIPYPTWGDNGEKRRHARRSVKRVLEELGATHVTAIDDSRKEPQGYIVYGSLQTDTGSLNLIEKILRKRGGQRFSQKIKR